MNVATSLTSDTTSWSPVPRKQHPLAVRPSVWLVWQQTLLWTNSALCVLMRTISIGHGAANPLQIASSQLKFASSAVDSRVSWMLKQLRKNKLFFIISGCGIVFNRITLALHSSLVIFVVCCRFTKGLKTIMLVHLVSSYHYKCETNR